jgi:hypothetical protein
VQFGNVEGSRLSAGRWRRCGVHVRVDALSPRVYAGFDAASGSPEPDGPLQPAVPADLQLPRPPLPLRPAPT